MALCVMEITEMKNNSLLFLTFAFHELLNVEQQSVRNKKSVLRVGGAAGTSKK